MRILLLGANGQVGWELQRALAPVGELVALGREGLYGEGNEVLCGDLSRTDALRATLERVRPDVIVNAAAYTAVDRAESEADLAHAVNAAAPAMLAGWAAEQGALLVHYSTDYVFDGRGDAPWREEDATAPLSVYGRTKLDGERAIIASGARHLVFRTSWVYAARGGNFARTMLRLGAERERLTVVADQIGAPTGADLIADVTAHALRVVRADASRAGLYHLAAAGTTSWREYACQVFDEARALGVALAVNEVAPIATADWPTPATRPLNSRLDTRRLRDAFGLVLPDWRAGVSRMVAEIVEPRIGAG